MISIYEAIGAKKAKTHLTYRYLINNELAFVNFKDEMAGKYIIKQDHTDEKY